MIGVFGYIILSGVFLLGGGLDKSWLSLPILLSGVSFLYFIRNLEVRRIQPIFLALGVLFAFPGISAEISVEKLCYIALGVLLFTQRNLGIKKNFIMSLGIILLFSMFSGLLPSFLLIPTLLLLAWVDYLVRSQEDALSGEMFDLLIILSLSLQGLSFQWTLVSMVLLSGGIFFRKSYPLVFLSFPVLIAFRPDLFPLALGLSVMASRSYLASWVSWLSVLLLVSESSFDVLLAPLVCWFAVSILLGQKRDFQRLDLLLFLPSAYLLGQLFHRKEILIVNAQDPVFVSVCGALALLGLARIYLKWQPKLKSLSAQKYLGVEESLSFEFKASRESVCVKYECLERVTLEQVLLGISMFYLGGICLSYLLK